MKRIIATVICIALIATMAISGSVAYLTDEEKDENVFQVGSVNIEQYEQERSDSGLTDFNQNDQKHPMVESGDADSKYTKLTFDETEISLRNPAYFRNYVDKIVTIENKGSSEAYVRNIIAIPTGLPKGADDVEWLEIDWFDMPSETSSEWTRLDPVEDVLIGGVLYDIYVINYTNSADSSKLQPEDTTVPTLLGFGLSKHVDFDEDNNTYIYRNEDGTATNINITPDQMKILVATQAVQASGFDDHAHAFRETFKEITTKNHPWYDAEDFKIAISGSENYLLNYKDKLNNTEGFSLVGNGSDNTKISTVKLNEEKPNRITNTITADDLTISNLTLDAYAGQHALTIIGDNTTINNVVVDLAYDSAAQAYNGLTINGTNNTITDTTFIGGSNSALYLSADTASDTTTIDKCKFETAVSTFEYDGTSYSNIYGGTGINFMGLNGTLNISNTKFDCGHESGYALYVGPQTSKYTSGVVNISDSIINAYKVRIVKVASVNLKNVTIGNAWVDNGSLTIELSATEGVVFDGCTFTSGLTFSNSANSITFKDCYYGTGNDKVLITASNYTDYFTNNTNASISFNNTNS